jgi:integrase
MHRYHEFHGRRNPAELGPEHVTAFLNALAQLPWLDDLVRAKTPVRLPVVLTRDEVRAVLARMEGQPRLMATLLYGSGRHQIDVCRGKDDKDRATMLPVSIKSELAAHLGRVRAWQWVFPATRTYIERETGEKRRHHLHETVVQHAVRRAVLAAGIPKRATCHTSVTLSPRTCSKPAATFAPCRGCSATRTSPRR